MIYNLYNFVLNAACLKYILSYNCLLTCYYIQIFVIFINNKELNQLKKKINISVIILLIHNNKEFNVHTSIYL